MVFIPNKGFLAELQGEEEFRASLAEQAEVAKAKAEPLAPRIMRRNPKAFEVQVDEEGVALVNTDHGGHLAEWGSVNNSPQAPLRRGVTAAGLRLSEDERT